MLNDMGCLQVHDDQVELKSLLNNNKHSEYCAPLTSFDWNEVEPKRLGTSSIDTTCTIWDIEKEMVDTQLIAHDKEVYDIAWGGAGVFASVSADGSVRVFDLRDKEHSTIIYESTKPDTPLLRLGWNKQDPRYMATILMDSSKVVVLDIRVPTVPVAELQRHQACVNSVAWAPHSPCHICTAGDDSQVPSLFMCILNYISGVLVNIMTKSSHCFQKCERNLGHRFWIMACPNLGGLLNGYLHPLLRVYKVHVGSHSS